MKSQRWHGKKDQLDRLSSPAALNVLRLAGLPRGRGRNYARIVWLVLASHLRWGCETHKTFVSNDRIAALTGLSLRAVELGVAYLHRVGKISRCYTWRGLGRRRSFGRVLELRFDGPAPVVRIPDQRDAVEILARIKRMRQRPAAAYALAYAAQVLARAEHRKIKRSRSCATTMAAVARLLGMTRGGEFNRRLSLLEDVGVLAKIGARWRGFVIFVQLAVEVLQGILAAHLPAPRLRSVQAAAEEQMAAMSEAFARLYPIRGSGLAAVG